MVKKKETPKNPYVTNLFLQNEMIINLIDQHLSNQTTMKSFSSFFIIIGKIFPYMETNLKYIWTKKKEKNVR